MSLTLDKIQMIKASCLSFSIVNQGIAETEIKGFSFDYTTQTKADTNNKLIFIQLKIEIAANVSEEQKKVNAGNFEFGFTYRVENLEELIQVNDEQKSLDKILHMSLLGIAFSTARGIILTKAANTIINEAYLPIVNPATLMGQNNEI